MTRLSLVLFIGCLGLSPLHADGTFKLKSEQKSYIESAKANHSKGLLDLNLGNKPWQLSGAVFTQLTGKPAMASQQVIHWQTLLDQYTSWRRVDFAMQKIADEKKSPTLIYSDPWQSQLRLLDAPIKKVKRDLGAVMMFFFNTPGGVNGKMGWANNHAPGMDKPADILTWGEGDNGYYNPRNNPGFWQMELLDARYAALDFLLLNLYGHEFKRSDFKQLNIAIKRIEAMKLTSGLPKLGLFDDTWIWGKPYFDESWKRIPDMADPDACAHMIFNAKWKPFFTQIPRTHWYTRDGKPVIYFYNGGTLKNRPLAAPVFTKLKALFKAHFDVEPFLCVDSAFWHKGVPDVADQKFKWFNMDPDPAKGSYTHKGTTLTHFMPRWDSTARHNNSRETMAKPGDRLVKDDALLKTLLNSTTNHDMLVIATWNDLGEGTGINRCIDYWWDGAWKTPHHFMQLTRRSQAGESLP